MATYYVSAARGSDSNNGTTVSTPLLTIGKAIATSGLAVAGDTVYIEPGIYRELISVGVNGSSGNPITVVGDGDGAGFRAGGYTTPVVGSVEIRGWTDDVTPKTTAECLVASGKSYFNVRNIKFIAGNGLGIGCVTLAGTHSDWTFEDCIFVGSATRTINVRLDASAGAALNHTFKRCDFVNQGNSTTIAGLQVRAPVASTEWSVNVLVQNCSFWGAPGGFQLLQNGGTGSAWSTGIRIQQCDFWFGFRGVHVANNPALTTPIGVYGCRFNFVANGIVATTAGQVVEDGNVFAGCNANLTSVTAGTHSIGTSCPAFNVHDERLFGGDPRPWGRPSAVSPALGAGNYGTPPTVDLYNRPRPAGGQTAPSAGALERNNTGVKNATYADSGSPACLELTGPSYYDRDVLIKAGGPVTITVKVRYDGNHGGTNKPRATLLPNAEMNYAGETKTATSAPGTGSTPNAYETLTFTAFTPSADGVLKIRMESRAAASNGKAYFDTISVVSS